MFKSARNATLPMVQITVDGQIVEAYEGEMVAAVLARIEPLFSRTNPVNGDRRAPYCMMGVCFECLVHIDGVASVQSCLTVVHEGMVVKRQTSLREIN